METKKKTNPLWTFIKALALVIFCCFVIMVIQNELYEIKYVPSSTVNLGIGDTITCNNVEITIENVKIKKKGTKIDSYSKIADAEWLGVIVSVNNKSDYEAVVNSSDFILINSNGEKIENSIMTYEIWGKVKPLSVKLVSGGSKKGYIQYANTNKDNSNLKLEYKCNRTQYLVDISK